MALLKTLHIAFAVLWLGNFVVTGIWSVRAFARGEAILRRFAVAEILFTDIVFTFGGGAAVVISGVLLARIEGIAPIATFWTRAALLVAIVSGILWLAILVPLELRMRALAKAPEHNARLLRAFAWWNVVGWLDTVALFVVIYLMVAKPT